MSPVVVAMETSANPTGTPQVGWPFKIAARQWGWAVASPASARRCEGHPWERVKQFPGREWEWVGDGWMGDGWVAPKTGSQQTEPIADCPLSSDSLALHSLLHFYGDVQRVGLGTPRT